MHYVLRRNMFSFYDSKQVNILVKIDDHIVCCNYFISSLL